MQRDVISLDAYTTVWDQAIPTQISEQQLLLK